MTHRHRTRLGLATLAFAAVAIGTAQEASSQTWGDVLGAIIKQGVVQGTLKQWQAVDPEVRACLQNVRGINLDNLVQQGIGPRDHRLRDAMRDCNQRVAQARNQAEEQRQQFEADLATRQKQAEENRIAAEAAAQRARKEAAIRAAADRAAAEAHHRSLIAHFGAETTSLIENGKIVTGMTKDAVLEAKGRRPDDKTVIPPDDELWIYGSERIAISKGRVTYIGH